MGGGAQPVGEGGRWGCSEAPLHQGLGPALDWGGGLCEQCPAMPRDCSQHPGAWGNQHSGEATRVPRQVAEPHFSPRLRLWGAVHWVLVAPLLRSPATALPPSGAQPPLLSHHGWQLTSDRPVVGRTLDRAGQPRRPGCLSERETLASLWSLPPRSEAGPAPSRRSSRQAWLALDLTSGLNHPTHQLAAWPVPGPERLQRVIVL